jgi:tetratricopeptide (TPR) repeat protein
MDTITNNLLLGHQLSISLYKSAKIDSAKELLKNVVYRFDELYGSNHEYTNSAKSDLEDINNFKKVSNNSHLSNTGLLLFYSNLSLLKQNKNYFKKSDKTLCIFCKCCKDSTCTSCTSTTSTTSTSTTSTSTKTKNSTNILVPSYGIDDDLSDKPNKPNKPDKPVVNSKEYILYRIVKVMIDRLREEEKFIDAERILRNKLQRAPDSIKYFLMDDLGVILYDQNKIVEAENFVKIASNKLEEAFGEDDLDALGSYGNYGNILFKQNKLDEAEIIYIKVLTGLEKNYGKNDINTIYASENLAKLYDRQNKYDLSINMYIKVLDSYKKNDISYIIEMYETEINIINSLNKLKRSEEAEIMCLKTISLFRKSFGSKDTRIVTSLDLLGYTYFKNKKVQESLNIYENAKKILLTKFDIKDDIVKRVMYNIEKVKYSLQ